jgi:hypothetical protein
MRQLIKRSSNVGFSDEANPTKFHLAKQKSNNKTYFLAETSEGQWEWMDFGSKNNLSAHPCASFEEAIAEVSETEFFDLTEHDSRMGALTNLLERTKEAVRAKEEGQMTFHN